MQTSETADFFGFADRGRLATGLRADVNLIDFDRLRLHQPEVVADLPASGRRLVQRVDGIALLSSLARRSSRMVKIPARALVAWCAPDARSDDLPPEGRGPRIRRIDRLPSLPLTLPL